MAWKVCVKYRLPDAGKKSREQQVGMILKEINNSERLSAPSLPTFSTIAKCCIHTVIGLLTDEMDSPNQSGMSYPDSSEMSGLKSKLPHTDSSMQSTRTDTPSILQPTAMAFHKIN